MSAAKDAPPKVLSSILSGLSRTRSSGKPVPDDRAEGEEDGKPYETEDVKVGNTWVIVAGLALTIALVIGGIAWMRHHFEVVQREALPPLTSQQSARLDPPPPNLQGDPYADADRHQAYDEGLLSNYAYTDETKRRARIPIERAMTLTVGKPLDP